MSFLIRAMAAVAACAALSGDAGGNVAVDQVTPRLAIEYCLFDYGSRLSVLGMIALPDGGTFMHSTTVEVPDAGVYIGRDLSDVLIAYPHLTDAAERFIYAIYDLVATGSRA